MLQDKSLKCEDIIFDKTQDQSNYPLKIAGLRREINFTTLDGKLRKKDVLVLTQMITSLIWNKLSSNISYTYFPFDKLGVLYKNGTATKLKADVLRGRYETVTVGLYQSGVWENELNLLQKSGICYVTQKKRMSLMDQVAMIFPLTTCLTFLVFFAAVTALLSYSYLRKISYVDVGTDVLRAVMGSPMLLRPSNMMSRIIFAGLIFTSMIYGNFLQSQFTATLATTLMEGKNVRNAADLAQNKFKVYSKQHFFQFYYDTPLDGKIIQTDTLTECLELVMKDAANACLDDCSLIYHLVHDNQLQVSTDEFISKYFVLLLPNDSPLRNRIETLYSRLFEHGIIVYIKNMERFFLKEPFSCGFQRICLYEFRFAFYVLLISSVISILIFFTEKNIARI